MARGAIKPSDLASLLQIQLLKLKTFPIFSLDLKVLALDDGFALGSENRQVAYRLTYEFIFWDLPRGFGCAAFFCLAKINEGHVAIETRPLIMP